jgi:Flp pilus assembly protein TadG
MLMFGITFFTIVCFVGVAIDTSMLLMEKQDVQSALDEAVVAAATLTTQDSNVLQAKANAVFNMNLDKNTSSAVISSFKYDTDTRTLSATATGSYDTYLVQLLGFSTLKYTAHADSIRAADGTLEVALVLDNTWSMSEALDGSQTKIQVLKTAAQGLVSTIMTPANKNYVKVAVVPYADYVNVGLGNRAKSWLSVPADYSVTSTKTCTKSTTKTQCTGGVKGTCTGTQDGVPYTYSCYTTAQTCVVVTVPEYDVCSGGGTTNYAWYGCVNNLVSSSILVLPDATVAYPGRSETSQNCLNPIQPLTNDSSVISSAISNLIINIGTSYKPETYIPGGLTWGVNVLSQPVPFQEGAAYDAANKTPRKTLILMTDGTNTRYAKTDGTLASPNATQLTATYTAQSNICKYAKGKNIEVYTIGFGVTDTTALSNLKSCATDASHYFDAKSSAALIAAFQVIGGKLSRVRLVR